MPSQFVYWTSDGGGRDGGSVASVLANWIRTKASPNLIVYGGDIYDRGTASEFERFRQQVGDLSLMCETAGNHDWRTNHATPSTGQIPTAYESFWKTHAPPASKQPIDDSKKAGARYEHSIRINGWQLILDTGLLEQDTGWPFGDLTRMHWLQQQLTIEGGRSKIVFAHHSRLARGRHGGYRSLQTLWESLFDSAGKPRIAFTLAGHDHNVALYKNRGKANPELPSPETERGIDAMVNGAGGDGHIGFGHGAGGTMPDIGDAVNYFVTEIELIDPLHATVRLLSFGSSPRPTTEPQPAPAFTRIYDFS